MVCSDQALLFFFRFLDRYEHASGAKLNVKKSHGLLFGSWRDRQNLPVSLGWSNIEITVLGCRISNEENVDWNILLERFSDQLLLWSQLSFRGRAMY